MVWKRSVTERLWGGTTNAKGNMHATEKVPKTDRYERNMESSNNGGHLMTPSETPIAINC